MNLEELYYAGELIGVFAVVLSLINVGMQVRRNAHLLRDAESVTFGIRALAVCRTSPGQKVRQPMTSHAPREDSQATPCFEERRDPDVASRLNSRHSWPLTMRVSPGDSR